MTKFASLLPRLAELHDRYFQIDEANFFWQFPRRLESGGETTRQYYRRYEDWLSNVPVEQWECFCLKVRYASGSEHAFRFWEQLHDVFNEAYGAKILRTQYRCSDIQLISTAGPDWLGRTEGRLHYIEVKTIHNSDKERKSWFPAKTGSELSLVHTVHVPEALQMKIRWTVNQAKDQLTQPADSGTAVKIVLLVIDVDHNIDPMDETVEDLFDWFLGSLVEPGIEILWLLNHTGESRSIEIKGRWVRLTADSAFVPP
jgi:hypothetical protein